VADVVRCGDSIAQLSARLAWRAALDKAANAPDALLQFFPFKIVDGAVHIHSEAKPMENMAVAIASEYQRVSRIRMGRDLIMTPSQQRSA